MHCRSVLDFYILHEGTAAIFFLPQNDTNLSTDIFPLEHVILLHFGVTELHGHNALQLLSVRIGGQNEPPHISGHREVGLTCPPFWTEDKRSLTLHDFHLSAQGHPQASGGSVSQELPGVLVPGGIRNTVLRFLFFFLGTRQHTYEMLLNCTPFKLYAKTKPCLSLNSYHLMMVTIYWVLVHFHFCL